MQTRHRWLDFVKTLDPHSYVFISQGAKVAEMPPSVPFRRIKPDQTDRLLLAPTQKMALHLTRTHHQKREKSRLMISDFFFLGPRGQALLESRPRHNQEEHSGTCNDRSLKPVYCYETSSLFDSRGNTRLVVLAFADTLLQDVALYRECQQTSRLREGARNLL